MVTAGFRADSSSTSETLHTDIVHLNVYAFAMCKTEFGKRTATVLHVCRDSCELCAQRIHWKISACR
jgi:hypothetical protein